MRLAIDASNIRVGGGVTHLVELLGAAEPEAYGFEKVIVWARRATLERIEDRPWLEKRTDPALEGNFVRRAIWQRWQLDQAAAGEGADVMFVPGGSIVSRMRPVVTMSQNLLPFEWRELRRFGISPTTLKLLMLRLTQTASFRRADGVIFLTEYARDTVSKLTKSLSGRATIIPHGVHERFRRAPRAQRSVADLGPEERLRIAYVSFIEVYKHQWKVVEAVARLHRAGVPVELELFGAAGSAIGQLTAALEKFDPVGKFAHYRGAVDYQELDRKYGSADICVFASSCENMPNILLESMAAGLPIACSNRGPMPEVLGESGIYFDPEDANSIADALHTLIGDPAMRTRLAEATFLAAREFSWQRCAQETFAFFRDVGRSRA